MTVAELIEQLQKLPPQTLVAANRPGCWRILSLWWTANGRLIVDPDED